MKTIKVIDLLNKIANGEEVPEKIKIDGGIYSINGTNNICLMIYEKTGEMYNDDELKLFLNEEIEIIEEKKIPEKLGKIEDNDGYIDQNDVIKIGKKIDEIIDYLKSKGEEV